MQLKRLKEELAELQQKNEASEKKYKDLEDQFYKESTKSNNEIWHLRYHNKKLFEKVKKSKDTRKKL